MAPSNPLNGRPDPLPGRRLPSDWQRQAANHGGTFDRRDLSEMWKKPLWASKLNQPGAVHNIIQSARLAAPDNRREETDRADASGVRADGALRLIERSADGWEVWRDSVSGAIIRRRVR